MKISAAEAEVMAVVWTRAEAGGARADEILAEAGAASGWSDSTARTLIHRLIRKGALVAERRGGRVIYRPLLAREDWTLQESQGLLDRLFGGQVAGLVAHFAKTRGLTGEEVARLRRLVAELDAEAED